LLKENISFSDFSPALTASTYPSSHRPAEATSWSYLNMQAPSRKNLHVFLSQGREPSDAQPILFSSQSLSLSLFFIPDILQAIAAYLLYKSIARSLSSLSSPSQVPARGAPVASSPCCARRSSSSSTARLPLASSPASSTPARLWSSSSSLLR
jgi:hypothetical protein